MSLEKLFPTQVYFGSLNNNTKKLNRELLHDIGVVAEQDYEGQKWSQKNYVGGYTSYSSITDLHLRFPPFMELKKHIDRHVKKYVKALEVDLCGRKVEMTTCWINVMPPLVHHSLHLHPLSFISGSYYVQTPRDSGIFKIEDPRMTHFMASPPRKAGASRAQLPFVGFKPEAGKLILFESWLRHEVPANRARTDRISISFNYEWI